MNNPFEKAVERKELPKSDVNLDADLDERKGGLVSRQAFPFILKASLHHNRHVRSEVHAIATQVVSEGRAELEQKLSFLYDKYVELSEWKEAVERADGKRKASVDNDEKLSPMKSPRIEEVRGEDAHGEEDESTQDVDLDFEQKSAQLEQVRLELLLKKQELENRRLMLDIQQLEQNAAEDDQKTKREPPRDQQAGKPRGGQTGKPRGGEAKRCGGVRK